MRHEDTVIYQNRSRSWKQLGTRSHSFRAELGSSPNQLRRNTSSVLHNFAEGYYHSSHKQQRRFLDYALQSARESSASFDTALAFRAADMDAVERGKSLALELVRMLSKFRR